MAGQSDFQVTEKKTPSDIMIVSIAKNGSNMRSCSAFVGFIFTQVASKSWPLHIERDAN